MSFVRGTFRCQKKAIRRTEENIFQPRVLGAPQNFCFFNVGGQARHENSAPFFFFQWSRKAEIEIEKFLTERTFPHTARAKRHHPVVIALLRHPNLDWLCRFHRDGFFSQVERVKNVFVTENERKMLKFREIISGDFTFRAQKNAKNNVTNLISTVSYNDLNTTQRFYDIFINNRC